MMIDAPSYDLDSDKDKDIKLTDKNAKNIMNYVNSMM
jgi:hypothetical protein